MAELTDSGMLKEWWANPAVVGLMGFGTTTMATGLHNVGYWGAGPTLALAIAFGGTAQFIAGIVDLRKGSIFGGSAFMSYGAFWWSLFVLLYVQPKTGIPAGHPEEFGFFLMWTLFTLAFCIAVQGVGSFSRCFSGCFCWLSFCWTSWFWANVRHPWPGGRSSSPDWLPGISPRRRWQIRSTRERFFHFLRFARPRS